MPPFLIGLAVLFWGWEIDLLLPAALGAVILELPNFIRWRWDFVEGDLNRFWDLSYLLFLGAIGYSYMTIDVTNMAFRFIRWLPIPFFPFIAAVLYSAEDRVRWSTYSLFVHRKGRYTSSPRPLGRFVPFWYFITCFVASSAANERDWRFYTAIVVLGAGLLWTIRNRNVPVWTWGAAVAAVAALGLAGHVGLNDLQAFIENKLGQTLTGLNSWELDLNQRRTAIGSMSTLKGSDRIVLRVEPDANGHVPSLLRKASFNSYQQTKRYGATWTATETDYKPVQSTEQTTWVLSNLDSPFGVQVSMFVPRGMAIIPVPNGPCSLNGLIAGIVETNRCGSVRVREGLPLIRYTVKHREGSTLDSTPGPADLAVPEEELAAVKRALDEIGLNGSGPKEVLPRIQSFFQRNFSYRLYQNSPGQPGKGLTSLGEFLLNERAGHCEYFATATVLLLRQAGIPARYAVGFAVPEKSGRSGERVVRGRHAHAWTLIYIDGAWRDFDTTPASWSRIEASQPSTLQTIKDFLAWLQYRFASWRYYGERESVMRALLWLLPVLVAWVVWRLVWRKRRVRLQGQGATQEKRLYNGADSEFYQIEAYLVQVGIPRRGGQSLGDWLNRVQEARKNGMSIPPLDEITALHNAYRFDPRGITVDQRRELAARCEAWLREAASVTKCSDSES